MDLVLQILHTFILRHCAFGKALGNLRYFTRAYRYLLSHITHAFHFRTKCLADVVDIALDRLIVTNILHIGGRHEITSSHRIEILLDILHIAEDCRAHLVQKLIQRTDFILTRIAELLRHMAVGQLIDTVFKRRQRIHDALLERIIDTPQNKPNCRNKTSQ